MTIYKGREVFFDRKDLIVSKTNLKGHITYANHTFINVSGFTMNELIGKPHSVIRHSDMPRSIFKLLWETIQSDLELFAYVVNLTKSGDHYWVLAHVTPSCGLNGEIVGYHSTRRAPNGATVQKTIIPLYRRLIQLEQSAPDRKAGLALSMQALHSTLAEKNVRYDEFVAGLARAA